MNVQVIHAGTNLNLLKLKDYLEQVRYYVKVKKLEIKFVFSTKFKNVYLVKWLLMIANVHNM